MAKYDALYKWLKNRPASESTVQLSFQQIAGILGSPVLEDSAYKHGAWWSNSTSHPIGKAWLDAGWRVDGFSLSAETVTFVRS